jgi:G patch domain/KOW motif-containing protein
MGWKEGKAVGRNQKSNVNVVELKPRPMLQGLGAQVTDLVQTKERKIRPGDHIPSPIISPEPDIVPPRREAVIESDPSKIGRGSYIRITAGKHKGTCGTISDISTRSSGIVVKVLPSNSKDILRVWDDEVEIALKPTWMRPHIRCRIISKSFKDGRYYNRKCTIQDVTVDNTTVRLDTGQVVDGKFNS